MPTREALYALRCFPAVDGTKAGRDLAHRPRPIAETLTDLYALFAETERLGAAPLACTGRGRAPKAEAGSRVQL